MPDIILSKQSLNSNLLQRTCGLKPSDIGGVGCYRSDVLSAYTPYLLNEGSGAGGRQMVSMLSPQPVARELTHMSLSFGSDNTQALARMTRRLQELGVGTLGASSSLYSKRVGGFADAVKEYQKALLQYRDAIKSEPSIKNAARAKAFRAFQKLQSSFRLELKVINAGIKSRKGAPLSSFTRAANIARSSRTVAKLNVASQAEAHELVRLGRYGKFLGNGLAVIDFTDRIGKIQTTYTAGGNWEREMFIESSSFAASAVAGTLAVNVGSAALSLLIVATPIGWVGLVVGGVAVAGAAAVTSMGVNSYVKENAGTKYDQIMSWLLK